MKRYLVISVMLLVGALLGATNAHAQFPPQATQGFQADVSGTFYWGRFFYPPNPAVHSVFVHDGTTQIPGLAVLGNGLTYTSNGILPTGLPNINYTSGTLNVSLSSGDITTALGFTPYNSSNPAGYITSSALTRSFGSPARTLNTCFQISASRDAMVAYAVDVTTTVTLGGTPEGSVFLRTYTNSGCSTGQVGVISGSNGQPTTLTVAVGQAIKGSVNLYGMVPAGRWARIETVNTSGTPTFGIRAEQQEVQF